MHMKLLLPSYHHFHHYHHTRNNCSSHQNDTGYASIEKKLMNILNQILKDPASFLEISILAFVNFLNIQSLSVYSIK